MPVQSWGWEDPLEEGMATRSSSFAWRIPWTEEPGGLRFMGHKESDTTEMTEHTHAHIPAPTLMAHSWAIHLIFQFPHVQNGYKVL